MAETYADEISLTAVFLAREVVVNTGIKTEA